MRDHLQRLIRHDGVLVRLRRSLRGRLTEEYRKYLRILVGLVGIGLFMALFPRERMNEYSSWREGMVAPREVIAPFSFNVRKNPLELETERRKARNSVPPVMRMDPLVGLRNRRRVERFLDSLAGNPPPAAGTVSVSGIRPNRNAIQWLKAGGGRNLGIARTVLVPVLERVYERGVVPVEDWQFLKEIVQRKVEAGAARGDSSDVVTVIRGDTLEYEQPIGLMMNAEEARDELGQLITRVAMENVIQLSSDGLRALYAVAEAALEPNLAYDRTETADRQEQVMAAVPIYKRTVFKDERFIESHAVLTAEDIDEVGSLVSAQRARLRQAYGWQPFLEVAGQLGIVLLVMVGVAVYLRTFHPPIWTRPAWLFLCILLAWIPLLAASFVAQNPFLPVYIVPLALTAMLGTLLFGVEVGLVLVVGASLLGGAMLGFEYRVVIVNVVAGFVAAFSVRNVRNRNQFLSAMLWLPLAIAFTTVAIDLIQDTTAKAMWKDVWPGAVNGFTVPILAMGLLAVCEKVFSITTNMTLLELSDLNAPLLRELSLRAPGSYTHSIIIANLTESAAEAIGANALLARVGAYYHDIGKMLRPDHFVENQLTVRNPHDRLTPHMSALVVSAHIKDGVDLAERVGLPRQIIDFIPQHHGTMLMTFFYRKAQRMYGEENVSEEAFRYHGPKPQTREAAILMMADAVEAAVRSLRERTPAHVQNTVHQIIRERLDDGQFDECALTLRDLDLIEKSFLPVLAGALHKRIEYPEPITPEPLVKESQEEAATGHTHGESSEHHVNSGNRGI
ncbi:MAG TPA: HDIG domain-containing protein [Candidatus Latescibacteria bacterium]|nr:HDIG domain-containing protein [Candidatus Latescibacterota bacterium]HOF60706.1 HDIG domain-containing protein [Candidatus Latescibacterota bacterium]HOS63592.1 HDIG domain-containing protein [Candidatus Latescibacterota bacterium]HPK73342.1 HDIG domain-containing protein [Candidatus Latescibacterota bacterium]